MRDLRCVAVIGVGLVALVWGSAVPAGGSAAGLSARASMPPDEFQNPSWTALPSPTAFNRTPRCALTPAHPVCEVPRKRWPPTDPYSPDGYLNSGYWPAEKRPDIEFWADEQLPLDYKHCLAHLTHYCYLVKAKAEGYPISRTPHLGDLWFAQGKCIAEGWAVKPSCTRDKDWYMGYVEKVNPDGSFIASSGGSRTPADSGLQIQYVPEATDRYSEFVHRFPPGKKPKSAFPPTTTQPQLTATLVNPTYPANLANAVIMDWGENLYRPIQVTTLEGGKYVPNTDSHWVMANGLYTSALPYGGATSPLPYGDMQPGIYTIYVALSGTSLPPVVLTLTLT